jgi:hypothetical protein
MTFLLNVFSQLRKRFAVKCRWFEIGSKIAERWRSTSEAQSEEFHKQFDIVGAESRE